MNVLQTIDLSLAIDSFVDFRFDELASVDTLSPVGVDGSIHRIEIHGTSFSIQWRKAIDTCLKEHAEKLNILNKEKPFRFVLGYHALGLELAGDRFIIVSYLA